MPLAVIDGAILRCDQGTSTSELIVTNSTSVRGNSKRIASIFDHKYGENIQDFGLCKLSGQPCKAAPPQTPVPWFPGTREMNVCSLKPPLSSDSFLLCVAHGPAAIKVEDPGQSTFFVPAQLIPAVPFGPFYYIYRYYDFLRRHPDMIPPDYYLGYGNKFLNLFKNLSLTDKGEQWIQNVMRELQEAIENFRRSDPGAFDRLEQDSSAFRKFAFDTHPEIYRRNGIWELSKFDQAEIVGLLLSNTSFKEVPELAEQVIKLLEESHNPLKPGKFIETEIDKIESGFETSKQIAEGGIEGGKDLIKLIF